MKLTDKENHQMMVFAKRAAHQHYLRNNIDATDEAAWHFASRFWRSPEYIQAAADIIAWFRVLDEEKAAPFN